MRLLLLLALTLTSAHAQQLPHTLTYATGKSITLSLPQNLDIAIAAKGLPRARFIAQAPDGRIFVTSMYNLADNTRGAVYILDGWDARAHVFRRVIPYLQHLRNPNNLAFYTDERKQTWLYIPLTDKLVRYRYNPGDDAPNGAPQVLIRFPDYGLNYKYGGWHLTRTVAIATLRDRDLLFVAVGSSCNYCRELEAQRASVTVMNPDGSDQRIVAYGLRNAVGMSFISGLDGGSLFATNMGDDHLGDKMPEDTFFELFSRERVNPTGGTGPCEAHGDVVACAPLPPNYGWPTCYFDHGEPRLDHTPLPMNPGPNDKEIADRPTTLADLKRSSQQDSVYGRQASGAAAGTNLAAQRHVNADLPNLGPVPAPLTSCDKVPPAYTTFAAHSSPLGFEYFGGDNASLANNFLAALHGAGHPHIGTGYRVVRFSATDRRPQDFITGFLTSAAGKPLVHGRPCGILRIAPDTFLLTDDKLNLVYVIFPKR